MADYPINTIRNIGVIAHIDAGKTTTSERILFYTGISHKIGEVHEGDTVMDWMEQERERGITITSAATNTFWTPTYLYPEGSPPLPSVCFINKLDRTGASFERSLQSILDRLTSNAVALQYPIGLEGNFEGLIDLLNMKVVHFEGDKGENIVWGEIPENLQKIAEDWRHRMVEKISETDDLLTERYLEGKEITVPELKSALRAATLSYKLVPVLTGSALKNKGVQLVLDAVVDYLPSPMDLPPVKGVHPDTGEEISRKADDKEPFAALAFKLQSDPYVGQLTYFRVYSGKLSAGSYVLNASNGDKERIGRILRMHANHREELKEIEAGNIGALVGLKATRTGDTLCDPDNPIVLEKIIFPEPVVKLRIEPKTKADQEKMGMALKRLSDEDPTFRISGDIETGDTTIAGMGELHLEIIVERMKREFSVEANVGRPCQQSW